MRRRKILCGPLNAEKICTRSGDPSNNTLIRLQPTSEDIFLVKFQNIRRQLMSQKLYYLFFASLVKLFFLKAELFLVLYQMVKYLLVYFEGFFTKQSPQFKIARNLQSASSFLGLYIFPWHIPNPSIFFSLFSLSCTQKNVYLSLSLKLIFYVILFVLPLSFENMIVFLEGGSCLKV